MYIGKNIRFLRKRLGHNQTWLAKQIGKTTATVGDYEKNRSLPPIDIAIQVADIFGVDLNQLILEDLEAQNYQPDSSNNNTEESKQDELLFQLMAMKVLEMGEELKEARPDRYKETGMEKLMETVRKVLAENS